MESMLGRLEWRYSGPHKLFTSASVLVRPVAGRESESLDSKLLIVHLSTSDCLTQEIELIYPGPMIHRGVFTGID